MNTPTSSLSFKVSRASARAHFSPLLRRVTQGAALRTRLANEPALVAARSLSASPVGPAEALHPGSWKSNLLDRLQAPLTRFRD